VHKGLAKSIGISNFQGSLILDLLRYAKIRPATLQIEHHPYLVQPTLLQLAESEGIAVTAYSSFGPQSFIELDWQKAHDTPVLFEHPVVTKLAEKYNKTPAQILLRWSTQRGLAVIPKSNNTQRLKQNLEVTSFDLEKSELDSISGLDRNLRFNNPTDVSDPNPCTYYIRTETNYTTVPRNASHLCLGTDTRSRTSDGRWSSGCGWLGRLLLDRWLYRHEHTKTKMRTQLLAYFVMCITAICASLCKVPLVVPRFRETPRHAITYRR